VKIKLICILFAAVFSYAQFSSGTDYSAKEKKDFNGIGTVFHFEKNETEWKLSYGIGNSFTANSDLFSYGYGLLGENSFQDFIFSYSADHIFRTISASVTVDSILNSDQTTNIDIGDITFQDIDAEAGVYYKNSYGLFAMTRYLSFDEADETSAQYGIRGEYSHDFRSGKNIILSCEFNSSGNKDVMKGAASLTDIDPRSIYLAVLKTPYGNSELEYTFSYSEFYGSAVQDKDAEYIKAQLSYSYSFLKARSTISAYTGVNLTAGFDTPRIHLPYFYSAVEFGNRLFKDRIDLTVGWKYEMYDMFLAERADIMASVPEDIGSVEDISETSGFNKLFVKIGFSY
jgi:hypothetical protein